MRLTGGQKHGGVAHAKGCACKFCDPNQARFAAARAAALAARRLPVSPALGLAMSRTPIVRLAEAAHRADRDARTIRFRQLLHDGMRSSEAAEIIDHEFPQPDRGTP